MIPFPFGPEMGIDRFASPDAPFTFVLPERRNPSLIGDPRASITEGCACARAKAPLYTSVDFIALNTINAIETTKATNNTNMLKQPTGTNHVQFRFHQFGLGGRGIGGGFAPRSLSTSAAKLFAIIPCNWRFVPGLTGPVSAMQDGCREKTILSPTSFRRRIACTRRFLCDYSALRFSCPRRYLD